MGLIDETKDLISSFKKRNITKSEGLTNPTKGYKDNSQENGGACNRIRPECYTKQNRRYEAIQFRFLKLFSKIILP